MDNLATLGSKGEKLLTSASPVIGGQVADNTMVDDAFDGQTTTNTECQVVICLAVALLYLSINREPVFNRPMKGDLTKAILNQVVRMSHKGSRQNMRNGKEQISHRMSERLKVDYILKLGQDEKTRLGFLCGGTENGSKSDPSCCDLNWSCLDLKFRINFLNSQRYIFFKRYHFSTLQQIVGYTFLTLSSEFFCAFSAKSP